VEHPLSPQQFILRPATAQDASTIRQIISSVHINPTGLNWRRFILAVDTHGSILGCGQVKSHRDGSLELASIAVVPAWRGKGIAREIIEHLLEAHPGRLYLTCRAPLGALYQKFGFIPISSDELPPYFRRLRRLVSLYQRLFHQPDQLLIMRRH
jgi:N-acetylglutamate synthase-like GNAT family acetyltransferase